MAVSRPFRGWAGLVPASVALLAAGEPGIGQCQQPARTDYAGRQVGWNASPVFGTVVSPEPSALTIRTSDP